MSFKVGCDPEVFLARDGVPVPAIGLIGGTKDRPIKQGIGFVQEDNVMAEFNTPPAETAEQFSEYVGAMLNEVKNLAKKKGLELLIAPYARFSPAELRHPQAATMGCEPDYNAWTHRRNPPVYADVLQDIRVAAGHVHIGVADPDISPTWRGEMVRTLDLVLGVPSLYIDSDVTRRSFYGKAGAYRPKPYGVEYRVLSNFWITSSVYRKWVFNSCLRAYNDCSYFSEHFKTNPTVANLVRIALNHGDQAARDKIMNYFKLKVPPKPTTK